MQRTIGVCRGIGCIALLACAGMGASAGAATPPRITLTEVPSIGGTLQNPMRVRAIGSSGAITGQSATHAFVWVPGSAPVDIHPTPAVIGSVGLAVNGAGVVVGDACIPPPGGVNGPCGQYLFRHTPGVGAEQLNAGEPVLSGVGFLEPLINDSGVIAATADSYSINSRAVYFSPETGWVDLTPLIPGSTTGRARVIGLTEEGVAVLDAGPGTPVYVYEPTWGVVQLTPGAVDAAGVSDQLMITGRAAFEGGSSAFMAGVCMMPTDLDPQREFPGSEGKFINDAGMVAGTWDGGVFLYTPEAGMVDLEMDEPTIELLGMNEHGDITGSFHTAMYETVPVISLRGGEMMLVQDLVDPEHAVLDVEGVTAVNDGRQFVVTGRRVSGPGYTVVMLVSVSDGAACAADADGDGAVSSADISAFLTAWIAEASSPVSGEGVADFDGSGVTNSGDIAAFLATWIGAVSAGGC